jgi:hypothetical protein
VRTGECIFVFYIKLLVNWAARATRSTGIFELINYGTATIYMFRAELSASEVISYSKWVDLNGIKVNYINM